MKQIIPPILLALLMLDLSSIGLAAQLIIAGALLGYVVRLMRTS